MNAPHANVFVQANEASNAGSADVLWIPHWNAIQWDVVLRRTTPVRVGNSDLAIQRGDIGRDLYLVLSGLFEVGVTYMDGVSVIPLAKIGFGSVIGEQSFFDGMPRSANVWAVSDGELLKLPHAEYEALAVEAPVIAREFVFGLARVLSMRLRNTTFRVRR